MSVTDGDTLKVQTLTGRRLTVRLVGIDTPKTVDPGKPVECGGPEAADRLTELVANRSVVLTTDPTQDRNDRFGRLLAYVDRSGTDVGREMIRAGHAAVFVFERPFQRLASYRQAEEAARNAGRGVWGASGGNFHAPGTTDDAAPESRSESAERFIRRYYFLLNQRRFSTAWAEFSPNLRRRFAPYASWRSGFARTVGTRVNSVSVSLAGSRAVVRVAIRARDRDACNGRVVRQFFRVRWALSPARQILDRNERDGTQGRGRHRPPPAIAVRAAEKTKRPRRRPGGGPIAEADGIVTPTTAAVSTPTQATTTVVAAAETARYIPAR